MKTIEVSAEDLQELIDENSHLHRQVTELQTRGTELLMESRDLKKEVAKLQDGIRKHRDASGHNLCWYCPELWGLLPDKVEPKPEVPDFEEFMDCCRIYRTSFLTKEKLDAEREKILAIDMETDQ